MTNSHTIGQCHYQPDTGELVHPDKDTPWRLPRAEKQILTHLLSQRGHALSKQQLRLDDQQQLAFSDSAVVKGIFTLRHYIEDEQHQILKTVTGQGYCLALPPAENNEGNWLSNHFIKVGATILMTTLTIIVLMGISSGAVLTPQVEFQQTDQLIGSSSDPIEVHIISNSQANQEALSVYQQRLQLSLESCANARWDRAYIALSHDDMILNITLLADHPQHTQLRNIKISDFRLHREFLNDLWLEEANLCG